MLKEICMNFLHMIKVAFLTGITFEIMLFSGYFFVKNLIELFKCGIIK